MTMLNGQPIDNPIPPSGPAPASVAPVKEGADGVGQILGYLSIIFGVTIPPAGIVLGAMGLSQARKTGRTNVLAKAGLILGIIFTVFIVLAVAAYIFFFVWIFGATFGGQACVTQGSVLTCGVPQ